MQLGRYQVLKHLASGSIADVLLARASGLEGFARHVVIKRIRPELAQEERFAKAFLDEARIAASLNHHNIVQVHDIGEEGGAYYFAMEYVHGEDVRALLEKVRERNEHVPLEIAVAIIMAAGSGLHHAHEKTGSKGEKLGIVHRDVSPSNILVGYDGSVKLVDFGLAKAAARSTQTLAGTIKGKASYMSPEQCKGETVDRRTDVFCLGIVLWELVTAQKLFKGPTDFSIMHAVVEGPITPPSRLRTDIPAALDTIIMQALARKPTERYQTAEDLRAAVEQFAVQYELRTSNKALADYLTRLFGQRPEPWQTLDTRSVTDSTVELGGGRTPAPPVLPKPQAKPAVHYDDDEDEGRFEDDEIKTTLVADDKAIDSATLIEPAAFESESDTIADTSLDTASLQASLGKRAPADTLKSSTARPTPTGVTPPPRGVPFPANTRVTPPGGTPAIGTRRTPQGGYPAQADPRTTPPGGVPAIAPSSNIIRRDPSGITPPRRDPSGVTPPSPSGEFRRNTPPGTFDAGTPGAGNTPSGELRRNTPPGTFDAGTPRRDPSGITPARRDPSGIVPPGSQHTGNTPPGAFGSPRNTPPGAYDASRTGNTPPGGFPGHSGNTPPGAFPRSATTPGGYGGPQHGGQHTMLGVGAAGPSSAPQPTGGFKAWFAAYRSPILLGGGAGIAVVIVLMIVMRLTNGGSAPASRSIDAGVPDAAVVKPSPSDAAAAPTPDAAAPKHGGKGSGSAAH